VVFSTTIFRPALVILFSGRKNPKSTAKNFQCTVFLIFPSKKTKNRWPTGRDSRLREFRPPERTLQQEALQPASPAGEEVRLLQPGEDPALFVRLGERPVLAAGGVGGEGAGFEGAELVRIAAGQDEDVLRSLVDMLGEDATGRHVRHVQG